MSASGLVSLSVHAVTVVVLLASIVGGMSHVRGDSATVTMSAFPSTVTVTAGSSASTIITVHLTPTTATEDGYPVIECVGLPSGASCSNNILSSIGPPSGGCPGYRDGFQFTLTVAAGPSTPPGSYTVNVEMTSTNDLSDCAIIHVYPFEVSSGHGGGVSPTSLIPQQTPPTVTITVTVNPATPIPEYSFGLPLLATLTIIAYAVIKRRTMNPKDT